MLIINLISMTRSQGYFRLVTTNNISISLITLGPIHPAGREGGGLSTLPLIMLLCAEIPVQFQIALDRVLTSLTSDLSGRTAAPWFMPVLTFPNPFSIATYTNIFLEALLLITNNDLTTNRSWSNTCDQR